MVWIKKNLVPKQVPDMNILLNTISLTALPEAVVTVLSHETKHLGIQRTPKSLTLTLTSIYITEVEDRF